MRMGNCTLGCQIWGCVRIAFTERQNVGEDVELANARLIAAAPNLLANLKALWHAVAKYDSIGFEGSELLEVMSDARQAIEDAGDRT